MDTAIVIGGGPAGLVAAATLAQAGVDTTLLEAKAGFGGRAASERQGGFDLNQGPHALYVGSSAMRELKALGIDPPRWNPVSVTRSVLVRDAAPLRPLRGWGAVARLATADAPADMSAADWIAAHVKGDRARELAAALVRVTTFVADHDVLPADVARAQLRLGAWPGVRYLRGGWQWMVDALVTGAEHRGATLHARSAVRSLERRGDRWTVATDERELAADAVIVAAGLPAALAKLVDGVTPPGPPSEVSVLDLGLRRLPQRRTFALGLDEPTYLSKHSPPQHRDGILMSAMSYVAAPEAELERLADTVLDGWRDELLLRRHLPKMTAIGAVASPARRPPVTVEPGLFVAGDWIGPEGWLSDAAFASGAAAARAAIGARAAVPA
jgi:phytoene dehydrogenase-like protein